ncbi:MAG: L-rhamnose/proton symporter RhaT [Cyclobacteriaceae bacterium]
MEVVLGFVLVVIAGLGTGTMAWPFKVIKDIRFDQYLLVHIVTGIVVLPWLLLLIYVPDIKALIHHIDLKIFFISNFLSMSWGVANVLYLVGVVRIGAALTGAILSALGMSVGVVMPMILKGSGLFNEAPDLFSKTGLIITSGLVVILLGLLIVSKAGFMREKEFKINKNELSTSGSFLKGLVLVVVAGILSSGLSLSFVYGQDQIIEAVKAQGAGDMIANVSVWAFYIMGGALVNIIYAVYLMVNREKGSESWRKEELLMGFLTGVQFFIAIVSLGSGMLFLGALGASIGFGIQQSLQVIGNQLVGFLGGEWKGVTANSRNMMYLGLIIILIAVLVFAYSNSVN